MWPPTRNTDLATSSHSGCFRFPDQLTEEITRSSPTVIAFSNYSWNFELAYRIGQWAKERDPNVITVFGGPQLPSLRRRTDRFFSIAAPTSIFTIQNEGEIGFVDLLTGLRRFDFDARRYKEARETPTNCSYLAGGTLVRGRLQRILDLSDIPSPYLSGLMDEFFAHPLMPMIETTRGCPFQLHILHRWPRIEK